MASSPFTTKPLAQSVTFLEKTSEINNTSDLTKSNNGNPVGDRISQVSNSVTTLTNRVANAELSIASSSIVYESWSGTGGLQNVTSYPVGTIATVLDKDKGTHTDPITGTVVSNAGKYIRQSGGWKWSQKTDAAVAADYVLALVGDGGMAKTYPFTLEGQKVSDIAKVLIGKDDGLDNVTLQCYDADLAFTPGTGKRASFDGATASIKLAAGDCKTFKAFGTEPWSFVARSPENGPTVDVSRGVPLFISKGRLTATYTEPKLTADDRLSWLPDPVDDRWRAIMRDILNTLDDSPNTPVLGKLTYIKVAGSTRANNAVNLANPGIQKNAIYNGTVTTVPYGYEKGDGSTGYINTQLLAEDLGHTLSGGGMMAQPFDNTLSGGGTIMGNSSQYYVEPNNSSTQAVVRNGDANDIIPASLGSCIGTQRISTLGFYAYVNGVPVNGLKNRSQSDGLPSRSLNLLATNAAAGFVAPTAVPLEWAVAHYSLNDLNIKKVYDQFSRLRAVNAAIRAG